MVRRAAAALFSIATSATAAFAQQGVASQVPASSSERTYIGGGIASTTATNDGGRSIVEEVEAHSRVAPGDPMRVIQRTVVTVRNLGPDRQTIERQVFERDVNGRLALVRRETEEAAAK